jgi:hypothetical protein
MTSATFQRAFNSIQFNSILFTFHLSFTDVELVNIKQEQVNVYIVCSVQCAVCMAFVTIQVTSLSLKIIKKHTVPVKNLSNYKG